MVCFMFCRALDEYAMIRIRLFVRPSVRLFAPRWLTSWRDRGRRRRRRIVTCKVYYVSAIWTKFVDRK